MISKNVFLMRKEPIICLRQKHSKPKPTVVVLEVTYYGTKQERFVMSHILKLAVR